MSKKMESSFSPSSEIVFTSRGLFFFARCGAVQSAGVHKNATISSGGVSAACGDEKQENNPSSGEAAEMRRGCE